MQVLTPPIFFAKNCNFFFGSTLAHTLSYVLRCAQCEEAFYCDEDCQQRHAKTHHRVCMATMAAKARRANRERVARAVREFGKDKVEGAEEDDLCVICQAEPVDPVEVWSQK